MNLARIHASDETPLAVEDETLIVCDVAGQKISQLRAFLMHAKQGRTAAKEFEFVEYLLSVTHLAVRQISAQMIIDKANKPAPVKKSASK